LTSPAEGSSGREQKVRLTLGLWDAREQMEELFVPRDQERESLVEE